MAHFAKLNEDNVVIEVIVVNNNELLDETQNESEQKGIDFLTQWSGGYTNWKQTSYNSSFRKNYAGIGFKYDALLDAFIPIKQYASWVLNEETCLWEAPVPMPIDENHYIWNEETVSWDKVELNV